MDIIGKMLFNLQKFNKNDSKINLFSLTFSIESYQKMKGKSLTIRETQQKISFIYQLTFSIESHQKMKGKSLTIREKQQKISFIYQNLEN